MHEQFGRDSDRLSAITVSTVVGSAKSMQIEWRLVRLSAVEPHTLEYISRVVRQHCSPSATTAWRHVPCKRVGFTPSTGGGFSLIFHDLQVYHLTFRIAPFRKGLY